MNVGNTCTRRMKSKKTIGDTYCNIATYINRRQKILATVKMYIANYLGIDGVVWSCWNRGWWRGVVVVSKCVHMYIYANEDLAVMYLGVIVEMRNGWLRVVHKFIIRLELYVCDSCGTRVSAAVSLVCRWVVRVMKVYVGGWYRTYNNLYNERGVQSWTWGIYLRDAWKARRHEVK